MSKNNPYERDVLLIKSNVRKLIKSKGFRVTDDMFRALNDALIELVEKATIRATLERKKTISRRHV